MSEAQASSSTRAAPSETTPLIGRRPSSSAPSPSHSPSSTPYVTAQNSPDTDHDSDNDNDNDNARPARQEAPAPNHNPAAPAAPAPAPSPAAGGPATTAPHSQQWAGARRPGEVFLLWMSVFVALVAVVLSAVVLVVAAYKAQSRMHLGWSVKADLQALFVLALLAIFFSTVNLVRIRNTRGTLPVWMNIVTDAIVAVYAAQASQSGFEEISSGWYEICDSYEDGNKTVPDADCLAWKPAVMILLNVAFMVGWVLVLVHAALFVTRCYAIYRARMRSRPGLGSVRIPTGRLTVEFTIKLLRQQEEGGVQGGDL